MTAPFLIFRKVASLAQDFGKGVPVYALEDVAVFKPQFLVKAPALHRKKPKSRCPSIAEIGDLLVLRK